MKYSGKSGGCSSPHSYLRTQIEGSVAILLQSPTKSPFMLLPSMEKGEQEGQRIVREISLRMACIVYIHVPLMSPATGSWLWKKAGCATPGWGAAWATAP